ncbi:MAG TPA: glycoside hydrolase family 9 protein [Ferruginibacter sp.]|nr:glycoside hydrolase family 9 protein [Ferruginibacter sp.]
MQINKIILLFVFIVNQFCSFAQNDSAVIRLNLLGYSPNSVKVAVLCDKQEQIIKDFYLADAKTKKIVFKKAAGKAFGSYGPFLQTQRLSFSEFTKPGTYNIVAGKAISPVFTIGDDVHKGTADFCLQYMRQQRSGFNPFLKDSCHTHDGYTLYGPMPDSTHIDVSGGWHDASDYLQYSATSANATYHLLMAYRDFPNVFTDEKLANGLDGKNGFPDVLDEATWGIDWLLKMNPSANIMFNQLADDRDHISMRMPKLDSQYRKRYERPVYFINGEPQQRGKFLNNTTGTSSTAAKFASVYALAHFLYETDSIFRKHNKNKGYYAKAFEALEYAEKKPGVTQTVSVRSPYIYAEENWVDDMELANAAIHDMVIHAAMGADNGSRMMQAIGYAKREKITPWLGADTAKHYQWYPFVNVGHYELIKQLQSRQHGPKVGYSKKSIEDFWNYSDTVLKYYRTGIEKVWNKASQNAFYRGVPFIWCSNNLTTSFATQCYWYSSLSKDNSFEELEQANFDWLFGCNPWGTSFVYGLPQNSDYPADPHSAFTHLKNYPINGGLVDGPVYGSIYKSLIGIKLYQPDEYAAFQSDLVVYHDDYGDYSTNEPTMDGTASLIYLLAAKENGAQQLKKDKNYTYNSGAIIRGDARLKNISLVFTGHEFADGGEVIARTLKQQNIKASFFFTGGFYNDPTFRKTIDQLKNDRHYLGAHSNRHLLYADWDKRDSLLVTKQEFKNDLQQNYAVMKKMGISNAKYFLPPYEWYNDSIAAWTKEMGLRLINFTPGTKSTADYTTPQMKNYRSSEEIYRSIIDQEEKNGLNGNILLLHIGTDPNRTDKFYYRLNELIDALKQKGYSFKRIDELLD